MANNITPIGSEFRINTYTTDDQRDQSVAALADGGFVVTWTSEGQNGIYGQRYNASGVQVGSEFRINTTTDSSQLSSSVTALGDGGFVVAWASSYGGLFGQRYDSNGTSVGSPFQVTGDYSSSNNPIITSLSDGRLVVTWSSVVYEYNYETSTDEYFLKTYSQLHEQNGAIVGDPILLQSQEFGSEYPYNAPQPIVTSLPDGKFVVSLQTHEVDPNDPNSYQVVIYGKLVDPDNQSSEQFEIASYYPYYFSGDQQRYFAATAIATLSNGDFVVVLNKDGYYSNDSTYGQRFNANGEKLVINLR